MISIIKSKKIYDIPIPFDDNSVIVTSFPSDLRYLRQNAVNIVKKTTAATNKNINLSLNISGKGSHKIADLSKADILLEYANGLTFFTKNHFTSLELQNEIITCLINVGFFYQNVALDMLQNAYESSLNDSDNLWITSGTYLKKGLGILEYLKSVIPNFIDIDLFKRLSEMIEEYKLIQQLGILLLSLTKLKRSLSNGSGNQLDLQTKDLKEVSSTCFFYSKISVGCLETCIQLGKGRVINNTLKDYLQGLIYLLLSMDQFRNEQCGVAIGMLEQSINSFSNIIPRSALTSIVLSTSKIKLKPINRMKSSFKSTLLKARQTSKSTTRNDTHHTNNNNNNLLPVLNDTLENFIVPLISLLNYVYHHTNDKLFFQPVITSEFELKKFVPKGKSPQLEFLPWWFNNGKIEEYRGNMRSIQESLF